MSDGPHRSLPMRSGWKRVAERGDKQAFAPDEISRAILPALEQDCRAEMQLGFIDQIYKVFCNQEMSLFRNEISQQFDGLSQQFDGLREIAGSGIGRVILDHSMLVAEKGGTGRKGMEEALKNALTDRAARGARQVEEHYCRESSSPRAQKVRARIEEGIHGADISGLARQILGVDPSAPRRALRQVGLDDGVRF